VRDPGRALRAARGGTLAGITEYRDASPGHYSAGFAGHHSALTSQYLNIVKNSSLAAAIGYPDMVSLFAGTVLNQTGQAIETIAITMSVYLIISLVISLLMNLYNRRIALVER
jgi:uncharacterized membrane protein YcfT